MSRTLDLSDASHHRNAGIDALRIIGIQAVIAGHIWTQGIQHTLIFPWHVILFFCISGYLWRPGRSVHDEATRRARSLLHPYVFWLCTISVLYIPMVAVDGGPVQALKALGGAVWGGARAVHPYSAFWFVSSLFFACLLTRVLEPLSTRAQILVTLAATLIGSMAATLLIQFPLAIGMAPIGFVFIQAGRWFRSLVPRTRAPATYGALLIAVPASAVLTHHVEPMDLKVGDFGTPVLSLVCGLSICAGLVLLFEKIYPLMGFRINDWTSSLAKTGLAVVLAHAYVLELMKAQNNITTFILVTAISWAVALILSRTPWAAVSIGLSTKTDRTAARPPVAQGQP